MFWHSCDNNCHILHICKFRIYWHLKSKVFGCFSYSSMLCIYLSDYIKLSVHVLTFSSLNKVTGQLLYLYLSVRVRCRIQNWSKRNEREESVSQTEPNWHLRLDKKSSTLPDPATCSSRWFQLSTVAFCYMCLNI